MDEGIYNIHVRIPNGRCYLHMPKDELIHTADWKIVIHKIFLSVPSSNKTKHTQIFYAKQVENFRQCSIFSIPLQRQKLNTKN